MVEVAGGTEQGPCPSKPFPVSQNSSHGLWESAPGFFFPGDLLSAAKSFSPGASGGVVLVLRASRCPGLWWPLMFQTCYRGNRDLP